jgi:connector enhancer of kinase suppressor of Ras 2
VWLRAWFVLKSTLFYGFKTPQSTKAEIMIALPGFTASLADEVKSRRFAFKVYHTGKSERCLQPVVIRSVGQNAYCMLFIW